MPKTITVFVYKDGQLTYHLDNRNELRKEVLGQLTRFWDVLTGKGWGKVIDPEAAADILLDSFIHLRVEGGLIACSTVQPWFSDEVMLAEEVVYDLAPKDIVPAMEALAKLLGCSRIVVGTRAVSRDRHLALAKVFQQEGMSVSTVELMREVHQSSEECP